MITKLLRLMTNKRVTSYVVCLNTEGYCGKIKNNEMTFKIPAVKLESDKNDELTNAYIEKNNISKGEISLSASNLLYMPKLNTIGIGLYMEKKILLNIAFDLSDQLHLFYLGGLLISKSLLVVHNKNLRSTMNITFRDEQNEFTLKANQLLEVITEKIALKYLKENPKYKDFKKDQITQLFKDNPKYLAGIFDEIQNMWIEAEK